MNICGNSISGTENNHDKTLRQEHTVYLSNSKKASVVRAQLTKRILADDGIRQVTKRGLDHKDLGFY